MQRRLTIALLLTALASIVLVGFGVLAMAQVSARSNAETAVTNRLPAIANRGQADRDDRGRRELRRAFEFERIEPVVIDDSGQVRVLSGPRRQPDDPIDLALDEEQLGSFLAQETVLFAKPSSVIGIRKIESDNAELPNGVGGLTNPVLGVLVEQQVTTVNRQSVAWFLLSSLVVLIGAALAGSWLARRLIKPIQEIKHTTSAIAAGDLQARAVVPGNDEVSDLANEVNQMAADLERSRALDRQFLMSISHDLKTPLTAISGYGEALSDGAIDDPQRVGGIIQNQARRLDRLVGDLLDLARLDANRFTLNSATFDASIIVGRTAAGLTQKATASGISLITKVPGPSPTTGDPDRAEQAIGNLIENALRFANKQIRVAVDQDADWTIVAVSDDGPGISPEDQEYIFDRLYTGKSQPKQAENSTGLGLAIVKELAQAMGGHTEASTSTLGGAQLTMRLPRSDRQPE